MDKSNNEIIDLTMDRPYLSIGEVAAKFNITTDLLRKWERDFPRYLHPKRTSGDSRLYDQKALHQVAVIYRMLRVEGLSVEGTRRRLKEGNTGQAETRQEVIQRLQMLRQKLMGIVEELDKTR